MGERWTLTYETTGNWSVEDSNRLEQMARRVGMCPRDLIKLILNQLESFKDHSLRRSLRRIKCGNL